MRPKEVNLSKLNEVITNVSLFEDSELEKKVFEILSKRYRKDITDLVAMFLEGTRLDVFPPSSDDDLKIISFFINDSADVSLEFSLKEMVNEYGYNKEEKMMIKKALINIANSLDV